MANKEVPMTWYPDFIDLRSDTATRPTEGMREAMANARLGDEQKGEDPTINALEKRAATFLGQETALFLPTATMANQIAIALHCDAGDEILIHESAHIVNHEAAATSMISRAQIKPLQGDRGFFNAEAVKNAVRIDDPHHPRTRLVVFENTSNAGGGSIWEDDNFSSIMDLCAQHQLSTHIDGARLIHAAVKKCVSPSHWAGVVSTAQICFSKGLGCPFGAILAMPDSHRWKARRLKQGLGGALRQAGVAGAAMIYALDHHVERLAEDHRRTQELNAELDAIPDLEVEPSETNLIFFRIQRSEMDASLFCNRLAEKNVRMGTTGDGRVRACLHLDISDQDIQRVGSACRAVLS
jgi:threonine aldolase